MDKSNKAKPYTMIMLESFLAGSLTALLATIYVLPPVITDVQIFQRENNKPNVMRLYKYGQDNIRIEDLNNKGHYMHLESYLAKITSEADRNIEEAEIKKSIEWDKEE